MSAAAETVAVMTEHYPDQDVGTDTVQYVYRDYEFWTGEPLNRTVNRYKSLSYPASFTSNPVEWPAPAFEPIRESRSNADSRQVIDLPAVFRPRTIGEKSVNTLQEWECVVTSIDADTVHSMATSLIDRSASQHYMDIPIGEFTAEDRGKLTNGTVFRMIVGFVKKANGTKTRESLIYVRNKLPRKQVSIDQTLDFFSMD